jgi:hypothetical protein
VLGRDAIRHQHGGQHRPAFRRLSFSVAVGPRGPWRDLHRFGALRGEHGTLSSGNRQSQQWPVPAISSVPSGRIHGCRKRASSSANYHFACRFAPNNATLADRVICQKHRDATVYAPVVDNLALVSDHGRNGSGAERSVPRTAALDTVREWREKGACAWRSRLLLDN